MASQKKQTKPSPSMCLSKHQRLRSPQQFKQVYDSKQWGRSDHHTFNVLAIHSEQITELTQSRLGVTVSKKVSNLAVGRNRIKRQIREFYRHRQTDLIAVDLVITAKPSCYNANDEQRHRSLEVLWKKILKWQRWYIKQSQSAAKVTGKLN